jgi:hypothetical protein
MNISQAGPSIPTAPVDTTPSQTVSTTGRSATAGTASSPVRLLNPDPKIDPALGIVVTSYYSQDGALSYQYPTKTALAHYAVYGLPNSATSASGT